MREALESQHNAVFPPNFKSIEPIFKKYQGRSYWSKLNTLGREELRSLYPHWGEFAAVRSELDPRGRLLNPYLRELFG